MDPKNPKSIRAAFAVEGSRGDIQPYVALGLRMQERGNVVKMFTNIDHKPLCDSFDIPMDGVFYNFQEVMGRDDIKEALAAGSAFKVQKSMKEMRNEKMPEDFKKLFAALNEFKPTVIIAGTLSKSKALVYSVEYHIPFIGLDLQTILPCTTKAPAGLPTLPFGMNKVWFKLLMAGAKGRCSFIKKTVQDTLAIDINGKFELPLMMATMFDIAKFPGPCCYGFSGIVVPPDPEWTAWPNFHCCGFFTIDKKKTESMMKDKTKGAQFGAGSNDALAKFLSAGPAPVYLGWGSMICQSAEYMATLAVSALQHAGARGVLLGGWAGLHLDAIPENLREYCDKNVLIVQTAPHEWLFPQCSCIVHHGGSGTTAASVKSGKPTVITPVMGDQFDFAEGVNKIGCGVGTEQLSKLSAEKLGNAIKRCLTEDSIISSAVKAGKELRAEDGCANFMKILDDWVVSDFATGKWRAKHDELLQECKESWLQETNGSCFCMGRG
jgi:UDP:flavonoid glycosyltransferase YjiC (YdhE family)